MKEEMSMRKRFITLLVMLVALVACRQEEPVMPDITNPVAPSDIVFDITIQHPGGSTKGIKTDWRAGDKVFIFISNITTGYVTATLDASGTAWSTAFVGTITSEDDLGTSGTLHAVYLPYGNSATPTFANGSWSFNAGTDTYYLYASNVTYTVDTVGTVKVLSATVQMQRPATPYVQFYIPDSGASGTIRLACNALCPAGLASIAASNGAITENSGNAGAPINGYPDTLGGEEGYYVSGRPVIANTETADYYFALEKGSVYSNYYKHRSKIAANKSYQLPSYSSWPVVGTLCYVPIAGGKWKTVNEGASYPWAPGNLVGNSYALSFGEGLPTTADWTNLTDGEKTTWLPMDIWGAHGSLVVSESNPNDYIFLPWVSTGTSYYWMADFDNTFQITSNGAYSIPDPAYVPASGEAYARAMQKLDCFRIKAKEEGTTDVTFKYTYATGGIQYISDDLGVTDWTNYDGSTLHLSQGNVVYFKGTRTDCNCSGNTQLFTANKVCYIAGDITSLLSDPQTLPASAFRGAFSQKNTKDSGNSQGKDDEKPQAITVDPSKPADYVNWVDIDPTDPLILPATTAAECYMDMFLGCISLTHAPDLPATELADKCYFRMFHSCFNLTSMPYLPSVVTMSGSSTRRRYCYQMFQSCTGITALTEPLPVGENSTLQRGCFEDMFAHCTSLTNVIPGLLPATTLASDCYRGMFQDTAITSAPYLLAETLVSHCYRYMFNGCKSLAYIKCYTRTNVTSDGYTQNWLSNAKSSGDFHYRDGTTWNRQSSTIYGIPSGWNAIPDTVQ